MIAVQATVYISAVGWAQVQINGQPVAPADVLNPGRSNFDVRQWYLAYDVSKRIVAGEKNSVAVLMAAGWQSMGGHTLASKLLLSMTDSAGTRTVIPSSTAWVGSDKSPISAANIYQGEAYAAFAIGA